MTLGVHHFSTMLFLRLSCTIHLLFLQFNFLPPGGERVPKLNQGLANNDPLGRAARFCKVLIVTHPLPFVYVLSVANFALHDRVE